MFKYKQLYTSPRPYKKEITQKWVISFFCFKIDTVSAVILKQEVVYMVDSSILVITYLFFYGMIGLTIINVALIIALAILLSKQQ